MFTHINRIEAIVLFLGDLVVFYLSLWLALALRETVVPTQATLATHVVPFTIIFVVWLFVFYVAGLYEKHTMVLKDRLPSIILNAQIINSVLAILFFYLIPYFGITPKTILFIDLVVSFGLILFWRRMVLLFFGPRTRAAAILIGRGDEMHELFEEVNSNTRYGLRFVSSVDLDEVDELDFKKEIITRIYVEDINTIVIDTKSDKVTPILPKLYNLIFSRVRFIDMHRVYEDVFDRVPLSLVRHSWFLENVSVTRRFTYEFLKRVMDILISLPLFVASLLVYLPILVINPFVNKGPLFYKQERIGRNNRPLTMLKFRSMTGTDSGDEVLQSKHEVTTFGNFLRKTRIDELPQLWNVLRGDLSLIGPRPEFPALVAQYTETIPYYNVRHLIKPGISGYAQVYHENHPHHGTDVEKTREKLSYDLYYIKNRSFLLDLAIALKTMKTILMRAGR